MLEVTALNVLRAVDNVAGLVKQVMDNGLLRRVKTVGGFPEKLLYKIPMVLSDITRLLVVGNDLLGGYSNTLRVEERKSAISLGSPSEYRQSAKTPGTAAVNSRTTKTTTLTDFTILTPPLLRNNSALTRIEAVLMNSVSEALTKLFMITNALELEHLQARGSYSARLVPWKNQR